MERIKLPGRESYDGRPTVLDMVHSSMDCGDVCASTTVGEIVASDMRLMKYDGLFNFVAGCKCDGKTFCEKHGTMFSNCKAFKEGDDMHPRKKNPTVIEMVADSMGDGGIGQELSIGKIVRATLENEGYDGLANHEDEYCCCEGDSLMCCGCVMPDCQAGYLVKDRGAWHIQRDKPIEEAV